MARAFLTGVLLSPLLLLALGLFGGIVSDPVALAWARGIGTGLIVLLVVLVVMTLAAHYIMGPPKATPSPTEPDREGLGSNDRLRAEARLRHVAMGWRYASPAARGRAPGEVSPTERPGD